MRRPKKPSPLLSDEITRLKLVTACPYGAGMDTNTAQKPSFDSWDPWETIVDDDLLDVVFARIPTGARAALLRRDGRHIVVLDRRLGADDRKLFLAHELIHRERGIATAGELPPKLVALEERRVEGETLDRVVPPPQLLSFIRANSKFEPCTASQVAEEFGVPWDVADDAMRRLARRRAI